MIDDQARRAGRRRMQLPAAARRVQLLAYLLVHKG
jgi:hypothetical protein